MTLQFVAKEHFEQVKRERDVMESQRDSYREALDKAYTQRNELLIEVERLRIALRDKEPR